MNITEYQRSDNQVPIYTGRIILKEGYTIANADEYGYLFLGKNSCYSIVELTHPDDRASLTDALNRLENGEQTLLIRIRAFDNQYRYECVNLCYNGKVVHGFRSIDFLFTDIMDIRGAYEKYVRNVNKYHIIMGLSSWVFYEYEYTTDVLKIYTYKNTKSVMLFEDKMEEAERRAEAYENASSSERMNFETFIASVRKGADLFTVHINGCMFGEKELESGYEVRGSTLYKHDGRYLSVGVMRSTSRAKNDEAYYLTEAARDSGTGLLNKRAISEYTMECLAEGDKDLYFVIIDVDDFKHVNDTYGHMMGDQVLAKVSEIIRSVVAGRGAVGRFGGDEFFVLLENLKSEEDLRRILRTISKNILWVYDGEMDNFKVTLSIGVSKYPEDGGDYDILFKKADKALYIAKEKGKNRFIIYDEKKHGALEVDGEENRTLGIKSVLSNEKKLAMVSDLIRLLHTKGKTALDEAMSKVQEYFDVDGIAVYAGDNWKRVYSIGKYIGAIEQFPMEADDFITHFDENGTYSENNTAFLSNTCPVVAKALEKQETKGVVQVLIKGAQQHVMISFDVFNRSHKRSDSDKNYLTIVGKMVCELFLVQ